MQQVQKGDKVSVHYTGRLTDGSTFDSSVGRAPLEFTVGAGQMIKGFDAGVVGMTVGEKKLINIIPEEGYGAWNEEAVIEFPKEHIPADMTLEIGMKLPMQDQQGNQFEVIVKEIKENVILLDANHSLAGKDLIFEVELVKIG